MAKIANRFKRLLHPGDEVNPWIGILFESLLLIIFGAWSLIPAYVWLFMKPDPNAYKCGGPGWADYGCNGGTEAIIAGVINAFVWLIVTAIFAVAFTRLVNRVRKYLNG